MIEGRTESGRLASRFTGILAVMLVAGCGADHYLEYDPCEDVDLEPDRHVEYDSAGVTVVLSGCSFADRPVGWALSPNPTFEVGGGPDPNHQLSEIRGVTMLPSGAIAVLETSTKSISIFDSTGQFRHRVGREGEGPGEFATPVMVPNPYGDSVHIFDWRLARWTTVPRDGLETVTPPQALTIRRFEALGLMRGIVEGLTLAERISRSGGPPTEGMNREDARFSWLTRDSQDTTIVASHVLNREARIIERESGVAFIWAVPFVVEPSATTTPTHAVITDGSRYELRYFRPDGSLERVARVDRASRPVTQSELDAYTERGTQAREWLPRPDIWDQLLDVMELPDSVAALDALVPDTEGGIWARIHDWHSRARKPPRNDARWIVFDSTGRAQGVVSAPGELEIVEIGPDYVLGTRQDSLRVEYIQRYDLSRTPR